MLVRKHRKDYAPDAQSKGRGRRDPGDKGDHGAFPGDEEIRREPVP